MKSRPTFPEKHRIPSFHENVKNHLRYIDSAALKILFINKFRKIEK